MNVVFGWRCTQCNLDGGSPDWKTSQDDLDAHWRHYHGRPMPDEVEVTA